MLEIDLEDDVTPGHYDAHVIITDDILKQIADNLCRGAEQYNKYASITDNSV